LIDRFGKLPEPTRTLISTHKLRLLGLPLGLQKIDASETQIVLHFKQNTPVDPLKLIELVQKQRHIRFSGQDKLRVEIKAADVTARFDATRGILRALH
jgi:transcription-repair coupling factor (superfamily II helicase)